MNFSVDLQCIINLLIIILKNNNCLWYVWQEDRIQFHIVDPPSHGQLQIEREDNRYEPAITFMMADIYDNKITYTHDGSDTLKDEFQFTVSDGTNPLYKVKADDGEVTMSRPQVSVLTVSHNLYFLQVVMCDH